MSEVIKMSYAAMQTMQAVFMSSANEADSMASECNTIAQELADGALLGLAGAMFSDLVRSRLAKSVNGLGNKYAEMASDIGIAMQALKDSDQGAAGGF
jgi:uncharacterized protein YukE